MPELCLIAMTTEYLTSQAITALIAMIGSGAVLTFVLRGFWESKIAPMIVTEIKKHAESPAIQNETKAATVEHVKRWYDERAQREARLQEAKDALHSPVVNDELQSIIHKKIDNEIKRTDGLISLEVTKTVDKSLETIKDEMEKLSSFLKEDNALKTQLLQRMAKLEGAVMMSSSAAKASHSSAIFEAVKDPTKP